MEVYGVGRSLQWFARNAKCLSSAKVNIFRSSEKNAVGLWFLIFSRFLVYSEMKAQSNCTVIVTVLQKSLSLAMIISYAEFGRYDKINLP